MTTREKFDLLIDGTEIVIEGLRSTTNQIEIMAEAARQMVAEWKRFEEEVPHQIGQQPSR